MNKTKILLVEDDIGIREGLLEFLETEGYEVFGAENGQAALNHLASSNPALPALILLDLMMPIMDGFTFRDKQRQNSQWAQIPTMVMTARSLTTEDRQALAVYSIVKKPLDIEHVLNLIRSAIGDDGENRSGPA